MKLLQPYNLSLPPGTIALSTPDSVVLSQQCPPPKEGHRVRMVLPHRWFFEPPYIPYLAEGVRRFREAVTKGCAKRKLPARNLRRR